MLQPMLASLVEAPLVDPEFVYEPKYDGIRAIAEVPARGGAVRLWSRLGNEKTSQFPEIAAALKRWGSRLKAPVVLDGEIVALDEHGDPTGFQQLQGRIHLTTATRSSATSPAGPTVAFMAFDILRDGKIDLRDLPLLDRRARLESLFVRSATAMLRISEQVRGDGSALYRRALASGWEGLIAKHARSAYKSGKRTPDWRKVKLVHEQEFVIGGWTEPRQSRAYFGALLLGVYDKAPRGAASGRLIYVGHTGTGFNERELARVMKLLKAVETSDCPFAQRPRTNERPHWVEPKLVAQVKFTEWTTDGKLRHPVYLGLRDDKKPKEVVRETAGSGFRVQGSRLRTEPGTASQTQNHEPGSRNQEDLIHQLDVLEKSGKDGVLRLPEGHELKVTNLRKVFWPKQKLTKGDLFRYYVTVAPFLLPAVADRPLVMKRFPNGVDGKPFYQHRAEEAPDGVRVETVPAADRRPQLIGGSLATLLYMTQLAAISQDPWFSRVRSASFADYVALDLDPSEGVTFAQVLETALWVREELARFDAVGFPKTSGSRGLHIYVPLPPRTPYDAGLLLCQIIATLVAERHPHLATVERSVAARGRRVYVDYLQNILGKTLATAYSARASDYAGVAMPLTWAEVEGGVRREDFTIQSAPARLGRTGDLWAALRTSKGVDLSRVADYAEGSRPAGSRNAGRTRRRP